jgi:hypothetical protein
LLFLLLAAPSWGQTVLVTGHPASRMFLRKILQQHGWTDFPEHQLQPGECWAASDGRRVVNVDWSPPPAAVAALSDHPEEVDRGGMLFSGGLVGQRPVRLQYYHLGALAGGAPSIGLILTNAGSRPATVHVMSAAGEPSSDYFPTGHGNNVAWFATQSRGEGELLELAAGETRMVYRQPLPMERVVSGTLGLTLVDGPPVQFALVASPEADTPLALNNLLKEGDVHSRGFYPVATHRLRRRHVIGQAETQVAIGALRQETFTGVRELRGDYGVLYVVEVEVVNPTDKPATVQVLLNPRGGEATATFLWDGRIVEVPRTAAKVEATMGTVQVAAHSRKVMRMQTIPEGASSYPVRIVVRG